jgi:hypothetical protein
MAKEKDVPVQITWAVADVEQKESVEKLQKFLGTDLPVAVDPVLARAKKERRPTKKRK